MKEVFSFFFFSSFSSFLSERFAFSSDRRFKHVIQNPKYLKFLKLSSWEIRHAAANTLLQFCCEINGFSLFYDNIPILKEIQWSSTLFSTQLLITSCAIVCVNVHNCRSSGNKIKNRLPIRLLDFKSGCLSIH
eukprot:GDKJ01058143.1.p1 GENE.GDKJ01058143.1~~GDKJ01058143.1.p1  ORF type:complete len:133 (-),score=15.69 GDKJ01058143.1:106-504(-)